MCKICILVWIICMRRIYKVDLICETRIIRLKLMYGMLMNGFNYMCET